MASIEQTPEKICKRELFETIISPSQNGEKKTNSALNSKGRTVRSETKTFDIDILAEPLTSFSSDEEALNNAEVKCLEIVFPNGDRCGVNVSLLQSIEVLLTSCMQDFSPNYNIDISKGKDFCLVCEKDEKVDMKMLAKDLDFETTYYIQAC